MKKTGLKIYASTLGVVALISMSCERHEVIPPPENIVEYDCSFSAIVDDTINVLYSDNVDGYQCISRSDKSITSDASVNNKAIFELEIFNDDAAINGRAIIKHGSVEWPGGSTNTPNKEDFEGYYNATTYPFERDGIDGVDIIWYDDAGVKWVVDTNQTIPNHDHFEYTYIDYDSDTLDYVLFKASFNCVLAKYTTTDTTYRKITEGRFIGKYSRK